MATVNMDISYPVWELSVKLLSDTGQQKKCRKRSLPGCVLVVGVMESSHIRVMRIADNMRNVAVTEGDKVEAQIRFGWEIDAYPINEIAEVVQAVGKGDVDALVEEYYSKYQILLEGRDPKNSKTCSRTGTDRDRF